MCVAQKFIQVTVVTSANILSTTLVAVATGMVDRIFALPMRLKNLVGLFLRGLNWRLFMIEYVLWKTRKYPSLRVVLERRV